MLYPFRPDPPVSVEAVQDRLIWLQLATEAVKPVGTEGAVVSEQAGVVAEAAVLWPDWLPALSTAETVYEYLVDPESTVSEVEVVVTCLR